MFQHYLPFQLAGGHLYKYICIWRDDLFVFSFFVIYPLGCHGRYLLFSWAFYVIMVFKSPGWLGKGNYDSWRPVLFCFASFRSALLDVSGLFELSRAHRKVHIDRCLYGWSTEVYHDLHLHILHGESSRNSDYSWIYSRIYSLINQDTSNTSNMQGYVADDVAINLRLNSSLPRSSLARIGIAQGCLSEGGLGVNRHL